LGSGTSTVINGRGIEAETACGTAAEAVFIALAVEARTICGDAAFDPSDPPEGFVPVGVVVD
jgi:hypothetical protein